MFDDDTHNNTHTTTTDNYTDNKLIGTLEDHEDNSGPGFWQNLADYATVRSSEMQRNPLQMEFDFEALPN